MILDNNWRQIDVNEKLYPGDIIWLKFKIIPGWLYVKAAGLAVIDDRLAKHPEYQVMSINMVDDPDYVWYKIKIVDPSTTGEYQTANISLAGTVVALFAIAASVYFTYELAGVFKQIMGNQDTPETAATKVTASTATVKKGIGIAIPLIAVAAIIYLIKRRG
jgi:hypothetical protein